MTSHCKQIADQRQEIILGSHMMISIDTRIAQSQFDLDQASIGTESSCQLLPSVFAYSRQWSSMRENIQSARLREAMTHGLQEVPSSVVYHIEHKATLRPWYTVFTSEPISMDGITQA
jgi:hypothetical protein